MTTVVGFNDPINMGDAFAFEAMIFSIATGSHSSTSFSTTYATTGGLWHFTGTGFGGYQGGIATTGTITAIDYSVNGVPVVSITGASLSMSTLFGFVNADNGEGLMNFIFAGADTISGSTGFDNLFGFGGND